MALADLVTPSEASVKKDGGLRTAGAMCRTLKNLSCEQELMVTVNNEALAQYVSPLTQHWFSQTRLALPTACSSTMTQWTVADILHLYTVMEQT